MITIIQRAKLIAKVLSEMQAQMKAMKDEMITADASKGQLMASQPGAPIKMSKILGRNQS